MNVSYENSFNAIKKDILKETVDKKRQAALTKEVIPIEEKPNKPKEKLIVKNMNHHHNYAPPQQLNMTQEVKNAGIQISVSTTPTILTVEEMLNRTAAAQYASQRSNKQHNFHHDYKNSTGPLDYLSSTLGGGPGDVDQHHTLNDSNINNQFRSSVIVDKSSTYGNNGMASLL